MISTAEQSDTEPRPKESQAYTHPILKLSRDPKGLVLVVEDEAELAELLEYNLLRNGYEVRIAADGLEACKLIGEQRPDLILLDLMLPLLDGWEVCRMIRGHKDSQVAGIPIIMLSALGSADDRIKGYTLGADLYLPKPYAIKEVMLKTAHLIERHRQVQQLDREKDAISSGQRLQDEWQHALFHELRNQITVISGMAQVMSDQRQKTTLVDTDAYLDHIVCSASYLELLAQNYLLVRQVENNPGRLSHETKHLSLSQLFGDLKTLFLPLATEQNCRLEFSPEDEEIALETHPVALKIIFSSLIDNGLKYQQENGFVRVSAQRIDNELRIRISDNGPGIEPELRANLFEKFSRGTLGNVNGSGLGLYMSRTFARALGGDLLLLDEGPGSNFLLVLPLSPMAPMT